MIGTDAGTAYYWVIYSPDDTATVSGPGAKPPAPKGGKVFGPYNTEAEAQQGVQLAIAAKGASAGLSGALGAAADISLPSGLTAIGDFFNKLGSASTWIRVAEVLLGLGLLIVGVAKLASGTPVGQAAQTAGKAAAIL